MATNKKKKEVKVRDLKPSKDAKGGVAKLSAAALSTSQLSAAKFSTPKIEH